MDGEEKFYYTVKKSLENHNQEIEELFRYQNEAAKIIHENENRAFSRDMVLTALIMILALLVFAVVLRVT